MLCMAGHDSVSREKKQATSSLSLRWETDCPVDQAASDIRIVLFLFS